MEFKSLTKANAAEYLGKPVIFKLSHTEKPMLAKLCKVKDDELVISSNGTNYVLSVKHPVVVIVIVDISQNKKGKTESLHYPMNFLLASGITHILPFVGNYAILKTDKGTGVGIMKIKSISKCLRYMNVENGSSRQLVDIRHTTCYVIV